MNPAMEESALRRKAALLLGLVIFLSFLYFYEGGGWNQNSRFDLLRAIVEQHALHIDSYQGNTHDKAHWDGHYYSDKAPGSVFLAVPFAAIARPALRTVGVDPEAPGGVVAFSYIATAFAVALPAALAGICLFFLALRFGASISGAAFGTVALGLGTPFWAYASLFWAHALVGACLVFAFAAALKLRDANSAGREFGWALAVGLAAGWATVTEYPAAPASVGLALLALSQAWPQGSGARWRTVAGIGVGAAICLAILLAYLYTAFGSIRPSYSYYDPTSFAFMQQQGYLGLTYPHPDRLLKLLFGCSRGIFLASPVLLAAPLGLYWLWKEKTNRAVALAVAGIAAYYFLFNASFYWWKSGQSFGPRYAGASIPLLCLGLSAAWTRANPVWRRVLAGLAACSILIALMVISTSSQLSMQESCPLLHSVWPAFWAGHMALNRDSMLTAFEAGSSGDHGAFNLGQLMGLRGLASLIPLLVMWAVAAGLWVRIAASSKKKERTAQI
jgi:4-amino-4-deoxy-L-arabinose transferase-like glycosyltransferase